MLEPELEKPSIRLINKIKLATLQQFTAKQLDCYVATPAKSRNSDVTFNLSEKLIEFLVHPLQRTAVLLGDSGGGKTLFGQDHVKRLWQQSDSSSTKGLIPLWISLSSIENPSIHLVRKHLRLLGCTEEECNVLLSRSSFFLVLDGADEIHYDANLYEANGFADQDIKVLTTFRASLLPQNQSTQQLFGSVSSDLVEYELLPFTKEQRLTYIKLFVQHYQSQCSEADILQHLETLVDVDELTSNPYDCYLMLIALPRIVAKHQHEQNQLQRLKLTRQDIYKAFIEQRFERQQAKLLRSRPQEVNTLLTRKSQDYPSKKTITLIDIFEEYCAKLAQAMHERGLKQINCNLKDTIRLNIEEEAPRGGSLYPRALPISKPKTQDDLTWLSEFFDDVRNPDLIIIRSGCPIKQIRPGEWVFHHASLLDYFVADHLFNSAISDAQILTGHNLNHDNLQLQPDVLQFLVQRSKADPDFVKILFQIIDFSAHEPCAWKAAANAITILNYADVPLSGINLRRRRIGGYDETKQIGWGADLGHSRLFRTDARESDCSFVNFRQANLDYLNWSEACLLGVTFGEKPLLFGRLWAISKDGAWLVVSTCQTTGGFSSSNQYYLRILNSNDYKIIKEIKIPKTPCRIVLSPNEKSLTIVLDKDARNSLLLWYLQENEAINFTDTNLVSSLDRKPYVPADETENQNPHELNLKGYTCLDICYVDNERVLAVTDHREILNSHKTLGLSRITGGSGYYLYACFRPDFKQLAAINTNRKLELRRTSDGGLEKEVVIDHSDNKCTMLYNPQGTQLAILDQNILQLWNVQTLTCTRVLRCGADIHVSRLAHIKLMLYHPRLPQIYVSNDRYIRCWDTGDSFNRKSVKRRVIHADKKKYSPDGKQIAAITTSYGGRVTLYNLNNNEMVVLRDCPSISRNYVSYSQDAKYLAVLCDNADLIIWETATGTKVAEKHHVEETATYNDPRLIFRPDKAQIAFLLYNRTTGKTVLRLWNNFSSTVIDYNFDDNVTDIIYSPDGTKLVACSARSIFLIFDTNTGGLIKKFRKHISAGDANPTIACMGFSFDGQQFLTQHNGESFFCTWDIEKETYYISSTKSSNSPSKIFFINSFKSHPQKKLLAVNAKANETQYIGVWNLEAQTWLTLIEFTHLVADYFWIGDETKIRVFDAQDNQTIWQIGNKHEDTLLIDGDASDTLSTNQLQITNCYGLSEEALATLQATSSIVGEPCKTRKVADVIKERNSQIYISEGMLRVRSLSGHDDLVISPSQYIVSLVRKRQPMRSSSNPVTNNSIHVSLLIQGMTDNHYSYVQEIHLFLDLSKSSYLFQTIGTAHIQIRDKSPRDLESQALSQEYVAQSWNVSKDVAMQLLTNVKEDQRQKIDYIITGYSPGWIERPAYSCLTFCQHHLQKVGIPVSGPEKDLFCAFPTQHLPDPAQRENAGCMQM
jgi:WD40 repeat protein